jgi:outer membrane cobalamin receptor
VRVRGLVWATLLAAVTVSADETLPERVVTASPLGPAATATAPTYDLDAADLERSAALTLDDALRQVPGFSLFRRSGSLASHPTTHGVSLRGLGGSGASRALVLLDGVPLNDPFGGWVSWGLAPLLGIDRLAVSSS